MKLYPAFASILIPSLAVSLLAVFGVASSSAQSQSYVGGSYSENFDSMAAGTTTPPGWYVGIGLDASGTTVVLSDGSVAPLSTTAGYNFGSTVASTGDRALGVIPSSGDRNIEVRIRNDSGRAIDSFTVHYDGEQWRVGTLTTASALTMRYSPDGINWVDMGTNFNFTAPRLAVPVLFQNTAVDGNAPLNRSAGLGGTFTPAQPLPNGGVIYLRWVDFDNSNSDPGLAIDNFTFMVAAMAGPPLTIHNNQNGSVTVSWAFPSTGYLLESTPSLTTPSWIPVADGVDVPSNGNHHLTVSTAGSERYFRLRNPVANP